MTKGKLERIFELSIIGVVFFIGLVSLFYSWIDSLFNIQVNLYVLTVIAALASFLLVYIISIFDKG